MCLNFIMSFKNIYIYRIFRILCGKQNLKKSFSLTFSFTKAHPLLSYYEKWKQKHSFIWMCVLLLLRFSSPVQQRAALLQLIYSLISHDLYSFTCTWLQCFALKEELSNSELVQEFFFWLLSVSILFAQNAL